MWQGIFLPELTFSADSRTVSVQPPCAITCISICCTLNIPSAGNQIPSFGNLKLLHTLVGTGSAAVVSAFPYPCKATQLYHKGQRITKNVSFFKLVNIYCRASQVVQAVKVFLLLMFFLRKAALFFFFFLLYFLLKLQFVLDF